MYINPGDPVTDFRVGAGKQKRARLARRYIKIRILRTEVCLLYVPMYV